MASSAYQGTVGICYVIPPVATNDPGSGMQQSASQGVIGSSALVTASLPFQRIGAELPPIAGQFTEWDGSVP